MKIILADANAKMVDSWQRIYFGTNHNTPIVFGDIIEAGILHEAKAVVSPANSFGFMDGGVDLRYRNYFGKTAEDRLINKIRANYDGELLVGNSTFIMSGKKNITYIISAPTMRVPQDVSNTVNAYLAFKAAIKQARQLNLDCIVTPGMCSNTGGMDTDTVAIQMYRAYAEVILGEIPIYNHVYEAYEANRKMVDGVL